MVKVKLRLCMSSPHSGCPFQYDVLETTTIEEICNMVLTTNNHWWDTGVPVGARWSVLKICGPNNTFLENTPPIIRVFSKNVLFESHIFTTDGGDSSSVKHYLLNN